LQVGEERFKLTANKSTWRIDLGVMKSCQKLKNQRSGNGTLRG
jgi:hypothetical protein